jgi:hypothetical protein
MRNMVSDTKKSSSMGELEALPTEIAEQSHQLGLPTTLRFGGSPLCRSLAGVIVAAMYRLRTQKGERDG